MRLFIALDFSPRFKQALDELSQALARQAVFARSTRKENFHLTLAFLGEQQDSRPLIDICRSCPAQAFTLVTSRCGNFRRQGGDIWWLGLREQPQLFQLQAELAQRLAAAGYRLEERKFRPHLTLLRQTQMPADFDIRAFNAQLSPLHEYIDSMSLMQSTREQGKLVYRELYRRNF